MKVLFLEIDQERSWAVASLGPAFLAAYLRANGHDAALLRVAPDSSIEAICADVRRHDPGLIGVSLTSRQWLRAREVVSGARRRVAIPVIAGGLHATFAPDMILDTPGFDHVCLGEGELALLALVNTLEQGRQPDRIPNIRSASDRLISTSTPELYPPFEPIDALPFMARDMLDEQYGVRHMATQRGCPYPCTYCAARQFSDLYGSYADYGRRRSLGNVLDELHAIRADGELNYVIFLDDTFTINHAWVGDFCKAYAAEVSVPFSLHARVETVTPGMLEQLAGAGCAHITYGVESGSERVRQEIMKRHAPNQVFRDVFRATREAGILVTANYIIGTPGETREDIEQTLALHDALQPDDFGYFVFYPYPGTPLFHECKDKGYLPPDYFERPANHRQSILTFPSLTSADIEGYYQRFTEVRVRDQINRLRAASPPGADLSADEGLIRTQSRESATLG